MALAVNDVVTRLSILAQRRAFMEGVWRDVSITSFPTSEDMFRLGSYGSSGRASMYFDTPVGSNRSRQIYDSIGVTASERLSSGLESLITPQAERWHGFAPEKGFGAGAADTESAEAQEWLDELRDFMFEMRYDPQCGFHLSNQRALRSMVGFGQGIVFVEESFKLSQTMGRVIPISYQYIPLAECYLDVNAQGLHDTLYRSFFRTALQLVKKFGIENVSNRVKTLSENAGTQDTMIEIIHAVYPDMAAYDDPKGLRWCSQYVERESQHGIAEGGFHEFPYIIYPWAPIDGSAYAEGPAMLALAELKSLQVMGRDALLASQLGIRPPLASAYSPDVPVNLNPGSVNPKMVDPNTGRILVQPILQPPNASLSNALMDARRMQIKDAMYLNLFQSLTDSSGNRSATEAMIRAQEKGEFIGPTAARVQAALSRMVDREMAILERKGAFRPGSKLAPPEALVGKSISVRFSAPIDRLRRASDVVGIQHTLEMMAQMTNVDPDVVDLIDMDETLDIVRERLGAPRKIMRTPDEVAKIRAGKKAAQATQSALAAANSAADTANKAAPAIPEIQKLMNSYGAGAGGAPAGAGGLPGVPMPS